jgi:hypothetical protein
LSLSISAATATLPAFTKRCEYVEAGPAGPRGNELVVASNHGEFTVAREGRRIVVRNLSARCSGTTATVHNVDRIVLRAEGEPVTVDESEGRLGPGATRGSRRPGIEITADVRALWHASGAGADALVVRTLRSGSIGIDTDRRIGARPDIDLMLPHRPALLKLDGGGGDDRIDARRLTNMGSNDLSSVIRLLGGAGDDVIFGSPGSDWQLWDGPGADLVRAGAGNDSVGFGRGHDTIFGGPGNDDLIYSAHRKFSAYSPPDPADRIYGGAGPDQIIDLNGHSDLIRCGRGRDEVERERSDRIARDCEHLR